VNTHVQMHTRTHTLSYLSIHANTHTYTHTVNSLTHTRTRIHTQRHTLFLLLPPISLTHTHARMYFSFICVYIFNTLIDVSEMIDLIFIRSFLDSSPTIFHIFNINMIYIYTFLFYFSEVLNAICLY